MRASVLSFLPAPSPFEQLGRQTDQVSLEQKCGVERGNIFQWVEHANKFITPVWFRSNYHFASKDTEVEIALVKLSRV